MPVHKKPEVKPVSEGTLTEKELKPVSDTADVKENVAVDVPTEGNEVIEEVVPESVKPETSAEPLSPVNPLTDFKEKMNKEEMYSPFAPEKKNYMWPILLIFIIAIALLAGVFLYRQGIFKGGKENKVSVTPSPTIIPSPTKTIDLTKYTIEVQNGSEVAGEASRQKTSLESEGFTVSSIGNADKSDYTDTIIKAKKEVDKDYIAKLKNFLESAFTVGDTQVLSEDSSVPVIVIIGTKK